MFHIPLKIKNDIADYERALNNLLDGKIKDNFFRGIRVPWGFYSQRGGKIFMSRLRIPAGELTPVQLKAIGEASKRFASGKLHITTRQDIQIHDLPIENTIKVMRYLLDYNLSPRGGGGNTVRNITSCFMSGVCPYQKMDVIPLAQKLSEYLLSLDYAYTIPRKFKVGFSACAKDCAGAALNDVGFIATSEKILDMFVGGGMGAKSSVGKLLVKDVPAQDILRQTEAVMELFSRYGDRKDRHHNRLRFLIQSIGWEKFETLYRSIYEEKIKTAPELGIIPDMSLNSNGSNSKETTRSVSEIISDNDSQSLEYVDFLKYNVFIQKGDNEFFTVLIRIPQGEISADDAIQLSDSISSISDVNLRTTQRQNIAVINVPRASLQEVYQKCTDIFGREFLYPDTIYDVVSCKAALTCNLGICNAMALAPEITKKIKRAAIPLEKFCGLTININGCPNACGRHPTAALSFAGMAKKIGGRTVPYYRVYLGGKQDGEKTRLADEVGSVPARVVPDVIVEFLKKLDNPDEINAATYIETLKSIIEKYSSVPPYEEDRSYYVDYGRTEDFSLDGLSQGECGAGVIDMIESDIASAGQSLAKAAELKDDSLIKDTLYYASRALLITKGIDAKNIDESVTEFVKKFVAEGIASDEFSGLPDVISNWRDAEFDFADHYSYASRFLDEVKNIYKSMDGNFNFPVKYKKESQVAVSSSQETSTSVLSESQKKIYDLRGTPCPINYVKTKLRLEGLTIDDLLEVWLDDGEPIKNVPVSLRNDGQEIIRIEPAENFFKVLVRKKV